MVAARHQQAYFVAGNWRLHGQYASILQVALLVQKYLITSTKVHLLTQLCVAATGLIVSAIFKYYDNIVKIFAVTVSNFVSLSQDP